MNKKKKTKLTEEGYGYVAIPMDTHAKLTAHSKASGLRIRHIAKVAFDLYLEKYAV